MDKFQQGMKQKIGIQGVKGSFHHQVTQEYFGQQVEVVECMSFTELAERLRSGEADQAVMAIENSIAGSILPNYSLIDAFDFRVVGEHYLPIHMNLMALPGQRLEDITEVVSHPMALLQCQAFFEAHRQMRLVEDADTAEVAQRIARQQLKGIAAVAGPVAAEMYGLEVLAEGIHSMKNNSTRFLVLEKGSAGKEKKVLKKGGNNEILFEENHEMEIGHGRKTHSIPANIQLDVFQQEGTEGDLHMPRNAGQPEDQVSLKKQEEVDKVSLKFELDHVHGSLASILNLLHEHQLNLTKIQSLPIIETPWSYAFFIDVVFETYLDYQEAYETLKAKTRKLKVIGEYKNQQP